jgi:hypothetical protein
VKEYKLGKQDEVEVVPFGGEEEIPAKPKPEDNVKEAVKFFRGEDDEAFIEKEALEDLVEYAFSMAQTKKDVDAKLEKAKDEIKKRLKADSMEQKKQIQAIGNRQVILTKKNGSAKIDWEQYVSDMMKPEAVKELLDAKEAVSDGTSTSKYVTLGKPSISLEIL